MDLQTTQQPSDTNTSQLTALLTMAEHIDKMTTGLETFHSVMETGEFDEKKFPDIILVDSLLLSAHTALDVAATLLERMAPENSSAEPMPDSSTEPTPDSTAEPTPDNTTEPDSVCSNDVAQVTAAGIEGSGR